MHPGSASGGRGVGAWLVGGTEAHHVRRGRHRDLLHRQAAIILAFDPVSHRYDGPDGLWGVIDSERFARASRGVLE